jgi:branched-chain amino acid transport system ATP-binding protein
MTGPHSGTSGALLELDRITKRFGQVTIADELSLSVRPGDAVGVVGPNGAGKTSLFSIISGDLAPDTGEVRFEGRPVTLLDPALRCRLGIGRTYQVPRPFEDMTVFENVLVAAQQGGGARGRASFAAAAGTLAETGLSDLADRPAGRLGLLHRKRLELARALATRPRLLLLDEVAGGLTDPEVVELVEVIHSARATGMAVIWIEHVVRALTSTVDRLLCLAGGHVIADGTPTAVLASPAVREVFLGTSATAESLKEAAQDRAAAPAPGLRDPEALASDRSPPDTPGRSARGPSRRASDPPDRGRGSRPGEPR